MLDVLVDSSLQCHGCLVMLQVVQKYEQGVELRRYAASTWVETDVQDISYDKASVGGFQVRFWDASTASSCNSFCSTHSMKVTRLVIPHRHGLHEPHLCNVFS